MNVHKIEKKKKVLGVKFYFLMYTKKKKKILIAVNL